MKQLQDISLQGKKVLIRCDLNVPLDDNLKITDDNRIKQTLPTIKYALENGAKVIVMSHFEDPANSKPDPKLSLAPMAVRMAELLGVKVTLAPDCVGAAVEKLAADLAVGEVLLLENLRFNPGEKANDQTFANNLAKLADVYVSDAFATAHRAHASMVAVPKLMKEKAPGLLMQKELDYFNRAMTSPKRPLCVVLGGAKVSSKLGALINIVAKADKVIVGGAMANTFLAAQGVQMGRSLYEADLYGKALEILATAARRDCKVYLPVDFMVGPSPEAKGLARAVPALEIPADTMALDIGPASSLLFREAVQNAETIVWNGPLGAFENEDYARGTNDMVESLASAHGLTVVGGGDTDAAIHHMQLGHKFDYISTGGGAFLALLEGKALPGVTALSE